MIAPACASSTALLLLHCNMASSTWLEAQWCLDCLQFLYDLWWGHITPDTDFPKDVRRVLNSAFGELAARAQQTDLKRMLLM